MKTEYWRQKLSATALRKRNSTNSTLARNKFSERRYRMNFFETKMGSEFLTRTPMYMKGLYEQSEQLNTVLKAMLECFQKQTEEIARLTDELNDLKETIKYLR